MLPLRQIFAYALFATAAVAHGAGEMEEDESMTMDMSMPAATPAEPAMTSTPVVSISGDMEGMGMSGSAGHMSASIGSEGYKTDILPTNIHH